MAEKDAGFLTDSLFTDLAGQAFFDSLTEMLAAETGMDIVFVGRCDDIRECIHTVSVHKEGTKSEDFTYPLDGSPCEEVLDGGYCIHPSDVADRFPNDDLLIDMNICGYAGYPLLSTSGDPIGIIVGLSYKGFEYNDSVVARIHLVATRIASELEQVIKQEKVEQALMKAQRENQTKTMFVAKVANDIRDPITSILGFSNLIRNGKMPIEEIRKHASEMTIMSENILGQLNDLTAISSFELSGGNLEIAPFDLVSLVKSTKLTYLGPALNKGINIRPIDVQQPIRVMGDLAITRHAVNNMMLNALKYMGTGHITLSAHIAEDGSAVLTVTDDGIGMSQAAIEKALRPIDDLTKSYKASQNGTGLGLPFTMLMLEKQKARLAVESVEGSGTTIRFIFPPALVVEETDDFI